MSHRFPKSLLSPLVAAALALAGHATTLCGQATDYAIASSGTRELDLRSGTRIRLLLEAANLGSDEVEVAEITFPVGSNPSAGHTHGALEILYVVEGVLGHEVNGVSRRLEPGMVGVVKAGDKVVHRVLSDVPVKALVIWVPGGEADHIAPPDRWKALGGGGR